MRKVETRNKAKDWIRLAAKMSLLFTEPRVREAIGDRLKDTVGDLTDTISGKYEDVADRVSNKYADAADRVEAAADALQGRGYWASRMTGFLLGVGVGAGLGILLAPASGSEIRESVRGKAVDITNKIRQSVRSSMPSTGTEG